MRLEPGLGIPMFKLRRVDVAKVLVMTIAGLSLLIVPASASSPDKQSMACTHFVDNSASFDGDGSETRPWDHVAGHVDELSPGDVMCIRGDVSGSGRVYDTRTIDLDGVDGNTRSGTASHPITVRSYPGEKVILRNDTRDTDPSLLIHLEGVDYWVIEGLTLDNNGKYTRAIVIEHGADHNTLRDNEIQNGKNDGIVVSRGTTDSVIEGNHIHDFLNPDFSRDAHCIMASAETDNTLIRRNIIHDCSGDGVQIYRPDILTHLDFPANVRIVDNSFYRGTIARAENAVDIKAAVDLKVIGNEMHGYIDDSAVILQKASQNVLFEGNIIYDSLRGFNIHAEEEGYPEGLTIRNNLVYNITDYAIQVSGVRSGTFVHNTIVGAEEHAFRVVGAGLIGGLIQNNLFVNSGKVQLKRDASFSDVTVGYNGWFDTAADGAFTHGTDTVGSGDPGFVDYADDDYHLAAESLVWDAGTDAGVTTDFEGDPRPWGGWPDIGADEYVPVLHLSVIPYDRAVILRWTEYEDPGLVSYVITYTYGAGGSPASEGPSPISDIPSSIRHYALTELPNYVFYTTTVAARDGSQADLAVSNSVRLMPTDIFRYLPAILRTRLWSGTRDP